MQTQPLTAEEVIQAWLTQHDERYGEHLPEDIRNSMKVTDTMLQMLAEGRPVSARQVAEKLSVPVENIEAAFEKVRKGGYEFDEDGNLVGAALTLNPTRHQFNLTGKTLYTWCSLDALFLPGLLGRPAQVTSTCPQTGETISLTVSPTGVTALCPAETVLSIAVPGFSCARGENRKTGPTSESCTQMHFFASREAAEAWIRDYPGVAILTVAEAWRLAYENWILRRDQLLAGEDDLPKPKEPTMVVEHDPSDASCNCASCC